MKVVILNKSDATGGAAVVSFRLMEALREAGVDAHMLVCEKTTGSPFVSLAASQKAIQRNFLLERLKIYIANGFNRSTLFKIDTADQGLPLWKHPLVKEADAILINWVNQGMLSLKGFKKILQLGKPVIWTMHDMWCMTGICHHAASCRHFQKECGNCPLLGSKASPSDISRSTWLRKNQIYSNRVLNSKLAFVAVSHWLKDKAEESSLLTHRKVEVIHNAFKTKEIPGKKPHEKNKLRILFGAARLDDPIKGLDTLREVSHKLRQDYPKIANTLELAFFGNAKDPKALEGFALPVIKLGVLHGEQQTAKAYHEADIVVSASSYETLPGTLVEAQAYGCIPVSFNQGGQSDIIQTFSTGFLSDYSLDKDTRVKNLTRGIIWAWFLARNPKKHSVFVKQMKDNVEKKFSYPKIASEYLRLIEKLKT